MTSRLSSCRLRVCGIALGIVMVYGLVVPTVNAQGQGPDNIRRQSRVGTGPMQPSIKSPTQVANEKARQQAKKRRSNRYRRGNVSLRLPGYTPAGSSFFVGNPPFLDHRNPSGPVPRVSRTGRTDRNVNNASTRQNESSADTGKPVRIVNPFFKGNSGAQDQLAPSTGK